MYLFDTNIFLEIMLSQEKSGDCKKALIDHIGYLFISDFSLHSIGVILFRHKKEKVFNNFIADVFPKIEIVSLSRESYGKISEFKNEYNLDFDDAYQCKVAEERGLTIITMDKDFKPLEDRIGVKFI